VGYIPEFVGRVSESHKERAVKGDEVGGANPLRLFSSCDRPDKPTGLGNISLDSEAKRKRTKANRRRVVAFPPAELGGKPKRQRGEPHPERGEPREERGTDTRAEAGRPTRATGLFFLKVYRLSARNICSWCISRR
jgi:hypothetical protein